MEFLALIIFIVFVFGCVGAASSHSTSKTIPKKTLPLNDEEYEQWQLDRAHGKTNLNFRAWKGERISRSFEESCERKLLELVELGKANPNVKRRGTVRRLNQIRPISPNDFTKEYGIHPEESELISRWNKAIKISESLSIDWRNVKRTKSTEELLKDQQQEDERNAAKAELATIDFEWSLLNNKLLDDFYADQVKNVTRDDFEFHFNKPFPTAKYPESAGTWEVSSKKFGTKFHNGDVRPLSAMSHSRNQAIVEVLEKINSKKTSSNELVPMPFNPMNVDL